MVFLFIGTLKTPKECQLLNWRRIYSALSEWSVASSHWLIGGDLNETRSSLDSKKVSAFNRVPKFIDNFLEETQGLDVWRHLHEKSRVLVTKAQLVHDWTTFLFHFFFFNISWHQK